MTVSIRQVHPVFVGEVSGIDITRPLSRDEVAAVEAGMDRYAVLLFRDQKVTDEQQMAFSLNFGVLEDDELPERIVTSQDHVAPLLPPQAKSDACQCAGTLTARHTGKLGHTATSNASNRSTGTGSLSSSRAAM